MPKAATARKSDKRVDADQHSRFVEAAREAGADVDTDVADRLMGKLAKTKPEPKKAATKVKGGQAN